VKISMVLLSCQTKAKEQNLLKSFKWSKVMARDDWKIEIVSKSFCFSSNFEIKSTNSHGLDWIIRYYLLLTEEYHWTVMLNINLWDWYIVSGSLFSWKIFVTWGYNEHLLFGTEFRCWFCSRLIDRSSR
jgi:hypothetical protein